MLSIQGDYKDASDRVELWGTTLAFEGYISAELLIVDANMSNREVMVFNTRTQRPLSLRLPKEVMFQDMPASYNNATIAIYDRALASKPKLRVKL
jgi:hypothetical protein